MTWYVRNTSEINFEILICKCRIFIWQPPRFQALPLVCDITRTCFRWTQGLRSWQGPSESIRVHQGGQMGRMSDFGFRFGRSNFTIAFRIGGANIKTWDHIGTRLLAEGINCRSISTLCSLVLECFRAFRAFRDLLFFQFLLSRYPEPENAKTWHHHTSPSRRPALRLLKLVPRDARRRENQTIYRKTTHFVQKTKKNQYILYKTKWKLIETDLFWKDM